MLGFALASRTAHRFALPPWRQPAFRRRLRLPRASAVLVERRDCGMQGCSLPHTEGVVLSALKKKETCSQHPGVDK